MKELKFIISKMVRESIQEIARKSHIHKYRRSKLHPFELEKKTKEKLSIQQTSNDIPVIFKSTPEFSYEIPEPIKILLAGSLQMLNKDSSANKILQGVPISKKEAMELAKKLMNIPHFPLKQPRKLMNLLILLSAENRQ